jgi:hypothetical protein
MRWWDDARDVPPTGDERASEGGVVSLDPTVDPSVRGQLNGLIETFVIGTPREKLIRKAGFGMEPPFQRMRDGYSPVVEMRTQATRTFGFFVRAGVFVALRLDLADSTHGDPTLYGRYGGDVMKLLSRMDSSDKDETSDVETLIGDCRQDDRK